MKIFEFITEGDDLECTKDDPCGYCKKCKKRGTLKVTEADDFKTEIRKKKAFRRGQDDATNSKPKAVPSEFAELKQTYLKGYEAGSGADAPNDWRDK